LSSSSAPIALVPFYKGVDGSDALQRIHIWNMFSGGSICDFFLKRVKLYNLHQIRCLVSPQLHTHTFISLLPSFLLPPSLALLSHVSILLQRVAAQGLSILLQRVAAQGFNSWHLSWCPCDLAGATTSHGPHCSDRIEIGTNECG
jgi:hypothetical protein